MKQCKYGLVAIIGRPNVGKSTLMNRILGEKVAIVSDRPQTTRSTVRGILNREDAQVVYLDTAGLHKPKDRLGSVMVNSARSAADKADLIYLMVEGKDQPEEEESLINLVSSLNIPVFLLINKVDRVQKEELLPLIDTYRNLYSFQEIIPVSALKGDNVDVLVNMTIEHLQPGEKQFPEDVLSDQIERTFIAEFIREKVYLFTYQEVPFSTAVEIEEVRDAETKPLYVSARILVERDSQKGIIVGKGGQMIKKIGKAAREEIEGFMGKKAFLDLRVKVEKDWRKDERVLRRLGYS
jgi:GTP-binding protein Era